MSYFHLMNFIFSCWFTDTCLWAS